MTYEESDIIPGQRIIILSKPKTWSSCLSKKEPFDLNFPIETTVEKVQIDHEGTKHEYWAMLAEGCGWDLSHLIKCNLIRLITTESPKSKFGFKL